LLALNRGQSSLRRSKIKPVAVRASMTATSSARRLLLAHLQQQTFIDLRQREDVRVIDGVMADPCPAAIASFRLKLQAALAPYNHVGLFAPEVHNMYRHTALPE
jgi:hypothetical protein